MQVAKAVSPPRLTGRPFRETKSGSETDEIPKHKRPIAFIVDTIPCEILDGEEHPSIVFKSKANSKDAKKVLLRRPINVEYKRRDSSTLKAIVPWAQLKSRLETDFGIMRSKPKKVETEGDAGSEEPEEVAEKEQPATGVPESTRAAAFQSSAISITLPYGFQAVKTLAHPKATLKSALYQPSFSTFTVLDHQSVHIWKGSMRINHIPISDGKGIKCSTTVKKDKKSLAGRALSGITHWTFIDKYQIYIIANSHLQLKVLDSQMIEMSTTLTSKPVLWYVKRMQVAISKG